MADMITKLLVELLSVLALATKQIKQGRFSKRTVTDTLLMLKHFTEKYVKLLWGKDKIQAALQKLDRLTKDEGLAAGAQLLDEAHNPTDNEAKKIKRLSFHPHLLLHRLTVSCYLLGERLVQQWLSPPDSSTYHDFVSKRHNGTAAWFFESNKLKEWKETGSLLWIHGKRMFFESPTSACR